MSAVFILLSIFGVILGLILIYIGWTGGSLEPMFVLIIGIFVVIKELLDITHG